MFAILLQSVYYLDVLYANKWSKTELLFLVDFIIQV